MNKIIQLIIGIVAIVAAVAAAAIGRNQYLSDIATTQIPVPASDIPPYTVLDASMFEMREVPRAMTVLPYYQQISDMNGKITTAALPAELPVAQSLVIGVEDYRMAPANFEVLSIPVDPVSTVGGQIKPGDVVNLYQTATQPAVLDEEGSIVEPEVTVVQTVLTRVRVVDVRNAQGLPAGQTYADKSTVLDSSSTGEYQIVQILTLAVEPGNVKKVLEAVANKEKEGGLIWTTLATP